MNKPVHLINKQIAVLCINVICGMMTNFGRNFPATVQVTHIQRPSISYLFPKITDGQLSSISVITFVHYIPLPHPDMKN